jgi:hypothetical protein
MDLYYALRPKFERKKCMFCVNIEINILNHRVSHFQQEQLSKNLRSHLVSYKESVWKDLIQSARYSRGRPEFVSRPGHVNPGTSRLG